MVLMQIGCLCSCVVVAWPWMPIYTGWLLPSCTISHMILCPLNDVRERERESKWELQNPRRKGFGVHLRSLVGRWEQGQRQSLEGDGAERVLPRMHGG